jgi:hypothetical protein
MRNDRRGLAGLFDALIFLTVASVVSVSLLSALGGTSSAGSEQDERVDAVHNVLLRSTVIDGRGNPISIEEEFKLNTGDRTGLEDNISAILDLLLPGSEWRWSVEHGPRVWTFGKDIVPDGPVHCSIARAPFNGGEVVYRLDVWTAQS